MIPDDKVEMLVELIAAGEKFIAQVIKPFALTAIDLLDETAGTCPNPREPMK